MRRGCVYVHTLLLQHAMSDRVRQAGVRVRDQDDSMFGNQGEAGNSTLR